MLLSIVCFSERERDTDTATPRPKRCVDGELSKRCHAAAQGEPSRPNSLSSPCRPGKRGGGPIDDYGHGANTERGGGRNVPHSGYVERFPPLLFLSLFLPRLELCLMDRVSFEGGLNPLFPQPVSGVAASHLPGAQKRQRRGKELDIQAFPEVEGFPPRWPLSPFPLPPLSLLPHSSLSRRSAAGFATTSTQAMPPIHTPRQAGLSACRPGCAKRGRKEGCLRGLWQIKGPSPHFSAGPAGSEKASLSMATIPLFAAGALALLWTFFTFRLRGIRARASFFF